MHLEDISGTSLYAHIMTHVLRRQKKKESLNSALLSFREGDTVGFLRMGKNLKMNKNEGKDEKDENRSYQVRMIRNLGINEKGEGFIDR